MEPKDRRTGGNRLNPCREGREGRMGLEWERREGGKEGGTRKARNMYVKM